MKNIKFLKFVAGALLSCSTRLYSAGTFAYVTNSADNSVSVIDTSSDTVIDTIPVGFFPTDIAASPDGNYVYVPIFSENFIYVINTSTNTTQHFITTAAGSKPIGIAVAPNGFVYNVNFSNATVFVIDPSIMIEVDNFMVGSIFPIDLAIAPDGSKAFVVNAVGPKNVKVIDLSANLVTATITTSQQSMGVAINPAGTRLYVTNPMPNTVSVINTATNTVIATVPMAAGGFPRGVAVRPDGLFAYVVLQGSSSVAVIDTGTNTVSATIPLTAGSDPFNIAFLSDGSKAYVTETLTGQVRVIDPATNTVTGTIAVGEFPFSVDIANVP